MTPDEQFWWNWSVNIAIAIGTVGAVFIALFGQAFRAKYFPPILTLKLIKAGGEKAKVRLTWFESGSQRERWEDARYYHLRISNERRWSPANQTQVFLTKLEEPGPDHELRTIWHGDIPISWRHQEVFPVARTIGPEADCDLCSVIKGKSLNLHPLVVPHNLITQRVGECILVATLQARSNEGDSQIVRMQIAWDGKWHDGDQEMKNHLSLKVLG